MSCKSNQSNFFTKLAKFNLQDSYEAEILKFLSKELDISKIFSEYINLQASYHERMLKEINNCIPLIRGVLGRCIHGDCHMSNLSMPS